MVFSIYNNKGGSGKTTSLVSLAGIYADFFDKKVLVIDTDSQRNATDALLSDIESLDNEGVPTLLDALKQGSFENCIQHAIFDKRNRHTGRVEGVYRIDVVPGDSYLETYDEEEDVNLLKRMVDEVREQYDIVLFDIHPGQAGLTISTFIASDYILIPSSMKKHHIQGISKVTELLERLHSIGLAKDTSILGVYITMYTKINALQKYLYEQADGDLFFKTKVRNTAILDEATFDSAPINSYKVTHPVVMEYEELAKEILNRAKKK